jgi:hypothetical protein
MPEIRDWKDRVAKAKERREKDKALEGDERLVDATWQDRDVNVSWDHYRFYRDLTCHCSGMSTPTRQRRARRSV